MNRVALGLDPAPGPRTTVLDIENGTRWGWGPGGYTYPQIYLVGFAPVHFIPITFDLKAELDRVASVRLDPRERLDTLRQLASPLVNTCSESECFLGHNFAHDWGGIQGLVRDLLLPFLEKKDVRDTMRDMPKHTGPSRSLEYLVDQVADQLGVRAQMPSKPHIGQYTWEKAFLGWQEWAWDEVIYRNKMDVVLTNWLHCRQKELGWLWL